MSNNVNFFVQYISPNANTDEAKENRAYYSSNQSKDYLAVIKGSFFQLLELLNGKRK